MFLCLKKYQDLGSNTFWCLAGVVFPSPSRKILGGRQASRLGLQPEPIQITGFGCSIRAHQIYMTMGQKLDLNHYIFYAKNDIS